MITIKSWVKRIIRKILAIIVLPLLDQIAWAITTYVPKEKSFQAFANYDYYMLQKHYYLPIPDEQDMTYAQYETKLVGLDISAERSFEFLDTVLMPYKAEFNAFPVHEAEQGFYLVNGSYMAIDGNVYYSLIRYHKPRRVVEIGSGNSTLLAAAAIRKNQEETGQQSELICIEPYPMPMLRQTIPELSQLIEKRVQDVDLSFFEELQDGDILFIDSTHVLRPGGDVWWEFCEILPRLASGVFVHFHDISLPKPYPMVYYHNQWYWNEQYLLQAFLTYNSKFEIVWPGNYLMLHHPDRMQAAFSPEYEQMRAKYPFSEPGSFWMRVR